MKRLSTLHKQISATQISQKYNKIKISINGVVGYISFNSPQQTNSFSQIMMKQFCSALNLFRDNPEVSVIVIKSQLKDIFCNGGDAKFLSSSDFTYENGCRKQSGHLFEKVIDSLRKPLIAVINGSTIGGGFQLALMCDIILATEKAYFALPEINLGLIPSLACVRFAKIVGQKKAMKLILTGQRFSCQQAYRLNLVSKKLSSDKIDFETQKYSQKIASKALTSVILNKKSIKQASNMNFNQGMTYQRDITLSMMNTKAFKEGVNAFINKRKPNFQGL